MRLLPESRTRRNRLAVGLVVVLALAIFTDQWFLRPSTDEPADADAVVMLAGGRGERLERALELAEDGLAPVLVIMNGENWSKGREACRTPVEAYEVLCPGDASNTRDEARVLGELAAERDWDTIVLVTSDYHLHRASSLVGRCFEGGVLRQAAENTFPFNRLVRAVVREWAGTAYSWFVRGC